MRRTAKHVALAVLLVGAAAYGYAQYVLLPADWPATFRDAANTSSTPVLPPDTLKPAWEVPTEARQIPRVYLTNDGRQLLISTDKIYQPSNGDLLETLLEPGGYTAITTTTTSDDQVVDILLAGNGSQFTAYDLSDYSPKWLLDTQIYPAIGSCRNPTARNGVFYLAGDEDHIAAVDAESGDVLWVRASGGRICYGPPAVADIGGAEVVFLTVRDCGLFALNAADGSDAWSRPDVHSALAQPCVDEAAGIVYVHNRLNDNALEAYDASNGDSLWSAPLDHILNEPPTLGWAKDDPNGDPQPAVFAVTGGVDGQAGVYAFHRDSGNLLWSTTIPSDAHRSAVYCGYTGHPEDPSSARLYIATNNNGGFGGYPYFGDTYVLDAFNGQRLQVLGTDFFDDINNNCPVIVDVGGTPYMYVLTDAGKIVAWNEHGQLPLPPAYGLSIDASPNQISTNASAAVNVTLVNLAENAAPVGGENIRFSSSAAKNQGYVNPTDVVTDTSGIATTTFYSQNREGVVTVTATGPQGRFAKTTITITKGGGEEPPAAGSIQGTVYYDATGKPAKKVPVKLLDVDLTVVKTTTTNPRGKYSFQEVPFGPYFVSASANGTFGMTELIEISESSPSVTSPEGDVYLVEDPAP